MRQDIDYNTVETPYYLYDLELLPATLQQLKELSNKYGYTIHYALKANFEPEIVSIINDYGFGADCVSGNEVKLALSVGINPADIMFAGTGKSDRELEFAIKNNIGGINCESAEEFTVINDIAARCGVTARVLLRLNPDVEPDTHKYISTGQRESKFGISDRELERILNIYNQCKNIKVIGLHFHIGSQVRDLTIYKTLCSRVNSYVKYIETRGIEIEIIDLGGGLGINYDNPDSELITNFEPYFEIFNNGIVLRKNQRLHFEPGRAVVGQCGTLVTRVLYIKEVSSMSAYAIVDAGMTDLLRPALYNAKHKIECITSTKKLKNYTIGGPICESSDILRYNIALPELQRGDLLAIRSAGAYGSSMASNYNLRDRAHRCFLVNGKIEMANK